MADLTSKILGYRYWSTDGADYYDDESDENRGGLLYSQGHRGWAWGVGVNEAQCGPQKHEAPDHSCQCGLHAYYAPQEAPKRGPFKVSEDEVYGCVRGWGRMEVHSNGYRAQYAEIVALAYNEHLPRRSQGWIKALARDYEVECVPLSKLTAYALEQADPMPAEMIPEKPAPKKTEGIVAKSHFLDALQSQFYAALSTPRFTYGFDPAVSPKVLGPGDRTLEDIGLHTPQTGDVLKYGEAK